MNKRSTKSAFSEESHGYIYLFISRKIVNISSFGKLSLFEYIRFMTFDSYLVRVNCAGMKKILYKNIALRRPHVCNSKNI